MSMFSNKRNVARSNTALTETEAKQHRIDLARKGLTILLIGVGIVMFGKTSRANVVLLSENGKLAKDISFLLDDYNDLFNYCLAQDYIQETIKAAS